LASPVIFVSFYKVYKQCHPKENTKPKVMSKVLTVIKMEISTNLCHDELSWE